MSEDAESPELRRSIWKDVTKIHSPVEAAESGSQCEEPGSSCC